MAWYEDGSSRCRSSFWQGRTPGRYPSSIHCHIKKGINTEYFRVFKFTQREQLVSRQCGDSARLHRKDKNYFLGCEPHQRSAGNKHQDLGWSRNDIHCVTLE